MGSQRSPPPPLPFSDRLRTGAALRLRRGFRARTSRSEVAPHAGSGVCRPTFARQEDGNETSGGPSCSAGRSEPISGGIRSRGGFARHGCGSGGRIPFAKTKRTVRHRIRGCRSRSANGTTRDVRWSGKRRRRFTDSFLLPDDAASSCATRGEASPRAEPDCRLRAPPATAPHRYSPCYARVRVAASPRSRPQ